MNKKLWLVLSLGLVLLVIGLAGCDGITSPPAKATGAGGIYNNQSTGIWVTGDGKVTAVPDVAVLSLGVAAQASTVAQAQGQAAASMNAVVNALKTGGVAEKDIKTQVFNIQQLTRYDDKTQQPVVIGYSVTNTVTVKVRTVTTTGAIIDAVTKAGGDNTRINSISFTIDDPTPFESEARQKAMADARAKAKQLADLAGVKLGEPTYINESGGFTPYQTTRINAVPAASESAPTPISPGETEITLTVQITYAID
jgi:uncharacterized protein YggE